MISIPPINVTAFAKKIADGVRSPRRLGEALRMCAEMIVQDQRAALNFELFARAPVTPADIHRAWENKYEQRQQQQESFFGANPKRLAAVESSQRGSAAGSSFRESEQDDDRRATARPGAFA